MPDKSKKIFDERGEFIDDELARLEKAIASIQKDILEVILVDYASLFDKELVMNQETLAKLFELTPIFEGIASLNNDLEKKMAKNLLQLTEYSTDYFKELGMKVGNIKKQIGTLYEAIGITQKGAIVPDGYLSKLFGTINAEFQQGIRDYVLESIGSGKSYADFTKGFKDIIKGNPEMDGKLMRYYKTYAFDLYSKVARLTDNYYATELGLDYAVYDGTIINTSRPFCKGGYDSVAGITFENKVGKVFSRKDTELWRNTDWKGKVEPYNPIVDCGSINCRHILRWITEEFALELGYEPETDIK